MKQLPFSKIRPFILIAALLIVAGGVGYNLGLHKVSVGISPESRVVLHEETPPQTTVDFSLFWNVWQRIFRSYIDASQLNAQEMVYGAITGMVHAVGDPYTTFLPPKENEQFKEDLGGSIEGVGIELGMKENHLMVIAPVKNTPAMKAGVRAGDFILKVDGLDTTDWSISQAVAKIRGPKGTTVTLTILHENDTQPIDLPIVRDTITVPSVEDWVKNVRAIPEIAGLPGTAALSRSSKEVAYIRLTRFGDNTNGEWDQAVKDILAAQAKDGRLLGLILDLRDNPGGYLDGAVFVGSEFIRSGTIVTQVNSDGSRQNYGVDRQGQLLTIPMVVLVNKGTASAAEIVSGALHDDKRATLVGETTFGKGSVQTPQDLPGGAGLHITTGKWLTPDGTSINKTGITPDITVALDTNDATHDAQLAKAVELLAQ
ncbi:S41 family peptidase [Patescibacteria group bacterium]|nr:S41 family peptidase [Patescibacteria group bacterium]